MKVIKKVIFIGILVAVSITLLVIGNGYNMYKGALEQMPLSKVDIIAIGRAFVNDIKAMKFVEGGSTITQQLAKNIYFTQEKKITRKIAEVFMAFEIEKEYDKDQILELYLNTSYFGDGYYNVREASLGYFGKEPNQMTEYEAIMLAGIPNAPSVYSLTKNPELAKQRQKQVINKMIEYKYLTQSEADKILEQ